MPDKKKDPVSKVSVPDADPADYESHIDKPEPIISSTTRMLLGEMSYAEYRQEYRNEQKESAHSADLLSEIARDLTKLDVSPEIFNAIIDAGKKSNIRQDFILLHDTLKILISCNITGENANQFFKGGHFIANDNGKLYQNLKLAYEDHAKNRISSHFRGQVVKDAIGVEEQKGIGFGGMLPALLFFATTDDKGKMRSHMQAESSPWEGWKSIDPESAQHIPDALSYFCSKVVSMMLKTDVMNLGPLGWSPHADNNAISATLNNNGEYSWERPRTKSESTAELQANMDQPLVELENAISPQVSQLNDSIDNKLNFK